ncbi:unnamed protein product, partial [Laminaria digitata]
IVSRLEVESWNWNISNNDVYHLVLLLVTTYLQGVQLVAIGGHHRSRAAVGFCKARADRRDFKWEGSTWENSSGELKDAFANSEIPVTILYLGKQVSSLRVN